MCDHDAEPGPATVGRPADEAAGVRRTGVTTRRGLLRSAGVLGLGAAASTLGAPGAMAGPRRKHRVLVYSRTGGYRHASIPLGIATIEQLGAENGFAVEASEDPAVFSDRNLRRFTAVAFLNTTAEVMTPTARKALRRFVVTGGGWAGIHSAADTEYDWPFYTRLLAGGRFLAHPLEQPGVVIRESTRHISARHLPERWDIPLEEFYSFTSNPRDRARVLLSIDESTVPAGPQHEPSAFGGVPRRLRARLRSDGGPPHVLAAPGRRRPVLVHRAGARGGHVPRSGVPPAPARRAAHRHSARTAPLTGLTCPWRGCGRGPSRASRRTCPDRTPRSGSSSSGGRGGSARTERPA